MIKPNKMSNPWWRKSNHREAAMKTAVKKGAVAKMRRYKGGAAAWRRAEDKEALCAVKRCVAEGSWGCGPRWRSSAFWEVRGTLWACWC